MLVSRVLRALLDGAAPQEIVAITFTRKAAGEMRARLDEWLRDFALTDDAGRAAELRARGCDEAESAALAPRLATLYERLLEGLAQDLARLREGAPLPALGEGAACEHCSARGLCRRDHWAEAGRPDGP